MKIKSSSFGMAVVLLMTVSCGSSGSSGSSPVALPVPSTAPTAPPTTTPTPSPSGAPVGSQQACALGKGTLGGFCSRGSNRLFDRVDAAIEQLAREQPQIFNLSNVDGAGGYEVRNVDAYNAGLVRILQTSGSCAQMDVDGFLQVKSSNDFSEQYDVLLANGHAYRGPGSYRVTCNPANFPVDPVDHIHHIRVSFFSFSCTDGQPAPRQIPPTLPLKCTGHVTATAKYENNIDVDPRLHGPDIKWELRQGGENVDLSPYPNNSDFNKTLTTKAIGPFELCATILGKVGCMNGEVVP